MNERLYSITNRDAGFSSEAFPSPTGFSPAQGDELADELRAELRLNSGDDDYFTIGILAAVRAFPVYYELLPERGTLVDLGLYVRPKTQHEGGILTSDPGGPPRVLRVCSSWPATFKAEVEYLADDAATFRYDNKTEVISCVKMGDRRIAPAWPEDMGIRGRVDLHEDWTTNNVYRVIDYPVRFPYAALAEVLRSNSAAQSVLSREGLAGSFHGARSSTEKVALVAIALGRRNRQVYPE